MRVHIVVRTRVTGLIRFAYPLRMTQILRPLPLTRPLYIPRNICADPTRLLSRPQILSLTSRALRVPSCFPIDPTPLVSNPDPIPAPNSTPTYITPGFPTDLTLTSSLPTVSIPLRS